MIETSTPIHSATINGRLVRFFKGAADKPDMPWHAHDDLLAALALPRALRRSLRAAFLRHQSDSCGTVEVDGEPTLLAPHFVAQGLIGMAKEVAGSISAVPDLVDREYHREGTAALNALTAGLSPVEGFEYAMAAFQNQ